VTTKIEQTARLCHEVNRIYCRSLGDDSQTSWEDAPEWQRQSVRNGVLFHLTTPNAGPAASHANWLAEKVADGWVYGPVKDIEAKQHPCCVPYDDLPLAQRIKDELFVAVVKGCSL
jgi:hypothetical protein